MKTLKFYILSDPRTNDIRYVGKTTQSLKYRLIYGHLKECFTSNTYKSCWIKGLLNKNMIPIIELIEEIPICKEWEWIEKYWISQFRCWGFNLTNLTDGGDGNHGQKFSKESILKRKESIRKKILSGEIDYKERGKKISIARKGIQFSKETKEKIRLANIGKKQSPEVIAKRIKNNYKPILQYDKNFNFIKEWSSLKEASKTLHISLGGIINFCKNRSKKAGGFRWKYKNVVNENIV